MSSSKFTASEVSFLGKGPYSFSIEAGECVGLVGKSGIGKSALLRSLVDILCSTGEVYLGGVEMQSVCSTIWRKNVSLVPPESIWWHDNVKSHFVTDQAQESLHENIERLGLDVATLELPVKRLSTGEKQRLALLRAIQHTPSVLLLDEPTSALDKKNTSLVEDFVDSFRRNRPAAILWVSHSLEQLERVSSSILSMNETSLSTI